jgi:predicted RNase H-like HicB family nuclease
LLALCRDLALVRAAGHTSSAGVSWSRFGVPSFTLETPMNLDSQGSASPHRGMLQTMPTRVLRYVVSAQDGAFVAQCLDVDVASEGDTEDKAVANLKEALELRFEDEPDAEVIVSRAVRFGEITFNA